MAFARLRLAARLRSLRETCRILERVAGVVQEDVLEARPAQVDLEDARAARALEQAREPARPVGHRHAQRACFPVRGHARDARLALERGDRSLRALEHERHHVAAERCLERVRAARRGDPPRVDDRDRVAQRVGLFHRVCGEEQRRLAAPAQRAQLVPDHRARGHVEAGGGLVEEQHAGPMEQPARDLDAAAQATRELAHRLVGVLGEAEPLDPIGRALGGRVEVEQASVQRELLARGQPRVERGLLEHHADLPPHGGALAHHVAPEQEDAARGRREQRGEHAHGRRLARAVGPEQAEADAARHVEVDARERAGVAIALLEGAHLDRGVGVGGGHDLAC